MGDFRRKESEDKGQGESVDARFLEDLERATRLSIESYKHEEATRMDGKRTNGDIRRLLTNGNNPNFRDRRKELEIKARPRPSSRPISGVSPSTDGSPLVGTILSPPPSSDSSVTSIPPPCPFKRHRSLPYRRHITHPPIADFEGSDGDREKSTPLPSDDLILLASPLVKPKFSLNHRTTVACDTTYAFPLDNISPPVRTVPDEGSPCSSSSYVDLRSGVSLLQGKSAQKPILGIPGSYSPQSPILLPMNSQMKPPLQQGHPRGLSPGPIAYPSLSGLCQNQGAGTTSTVIGGILHNLTQSNSSSGTNLDSVPPLRPCKKELPVPSASTNSQSPSNLYKKVSDELHEMGTGDLIDFGIWPKLKESTEPKGKNILEYFDPLVIREMERKGSEDTDPLKKEKATISVMQNVDETYNASQLSCASTATSAFTYRASSSRKESNSLSLYPSLNEFDCDSLSGALSGTLRGAHEPTYTDASSFYDVYNPFEYLYTVSCSSPSGSGPSTGPKTAFSENGFSFPDSSRGMSLVRNFGPQIGPALPPRNSIASSSNASSPIGSTSSKVQLRIRPLSHDKTKRAGKLYENIEDIKNMESMDSETQALFEMVREVRFSCRHIDSNTNKAYIRSPVSEYNCMEEDHSVKIVVWPESFTGDPVMFTSEISSLTVVILEQSLMELEANGSGRDYLLRVKGLNEYLDGDIPLANYVYVQQCIKYDQDVELGIVKRVSVATNSWARTAKDDGHSINIEINKILPEIQSRTVTSEEIKIPVEVVGRESDRIRDKVNFEMYGKASKDSASVSGYLNPAPVIQAVKAVCVLLKEVVTIEIVSSLNLLVKACNEWNSKVKVSSPSVLEDRLSLDPFDPSRRRTKIVGESGSNYSFVEVIPYRRSSVDESQRDVVFLALDRVSDSVLSLVEMYSKSFPVSFRMKESKDMRRGDSDCDLKGMDETNERFAIRVGAIHRLKPEWVATYDSYNLIAEVYHGTRWLGISSTKFSSVTKFEGHWFFNTIVFDTWVSYDHIPICILPREGRVVFSLQGQKASDDNNNAYEIHKLGWASMQCFNFKGLLAQGNYLLPFWEEGLEQKRLGPAPNSSFSSDGYAPLLTVEFIDFGYDMYFPEVPSAHPISRDFSTLDEGTQINITQVVEKSAFVKFPPEDYEVLWEKRHYLQDSPEALSKVLLSAQLWDWASCAELHAMLHIWKRLDPVNALELLLPWFPDNRVREKAVSWISEMADEDLINLLPQLVEALSYETFDLSPLAKFLLKKSLSSVPFSHSLFWMLTSQVGLGKWASEESHCDPVVARVSTASSSSSTYDPKRRRFELMLNCLMVVCGKKWRTALVSQYKMIENLGDIAIQVKAASKDASRQTILSTELKRLNANIFADHAAFPLPISASTHVNGIHPNPKMSSYFNSNAVPLKVSFLVGLPEGGCVSTIFKAGDDLRQDMLTIQTIRLIEKWWLKEGLDLRVLTFSCVPTGARQGIVEMVSNAETLCKIQAEYGVTGVFRDSAIADWLAKMNSSTLDYRHAVENFMRSCAAYCVLTYVLGICDRHNDNIMLTKKGHLFHIDFGKFLGDAQMFIKFKRDRTPFVLTSDMLYVINDGEKGSHRFHRFVELCCKAFRIIRTNGNILVNIFGLMVTAGIPGVDFSSVTYIQKALLPDLSNAEAAAQFTRFIEVSLQNWFTSVNFFIHSLGQLRFSTETTEDPHTLSFVPTIFTMQEDGRIEKALVVSYQKRYDPEKYYLYSIKVKRMGQPDWSILHRTYKEFLELRSKLSINYPMADLTMKNLPRGAAIGRSNVKQVTERRMHLLQAFLDSVFTLADEISHSSLVYTFFHPILRDEEENFNDEVERRNQTSDSLIRDPSRIHGQIKLSLEYVRGALLVLIIHAVDLGCPYGLLNPSPYVKTYLCPDTSRLTKRKTRVVRRSKHPSFMEMLEYRLPLEMIRERTLQVSVWHYDHFKENSFLGGVWIPLANAPLEKETAETYSLTNLSGGT